MSCIVPTVGRRKGHQEALLPGLENETGKISLHPRHEYANTLLGLQLKEQYLETTMLFSHLLPSLARELLACPTSAQKAELPHCSCL